MLTTYILVVIVVVGVEGVEANVYVFCGPQTSEGHSEPEVVLLQQFHFPKGFGLKTGAGSPRQVKTRGRSQRQGFHSLNGSTFLHWSYLAGHGAHSFAGFRRQIVGTLGK